MIGGYIGIFEQLLPVVYIQLLIITFAQQKCHRITVGSFYSISWSIVIGDKKLLVIRDVLLFAHVFARKITKAYTQMLVNVPSPYGCKFIVQ